MKFILPSFLALAASVTFSIAEDAKPEGKGKDKKPNPEEAFKAADKDTDGGLTLDEFKASPRFKKDPSKAEEIFKRKDADANGKLSLDEFKAHGKLGDKKEEKKAEKKEDKKPEEKKVEEKKAEPAKPEVK